MKKKKIHTVTGIICITPGGYGFVKIDDNTEIFVPPQYINSAIHEDEVKIELIENARKRKNVFPGLPIGKVVKIKKRNRKEIVGELIAGNKIRPLSKHFTEDIPVAKTLKNVKKGDWVRADLISKNDTFQFLTAYIKEKIGKAYTVEGDINAIIKEFQLPKPYTAKEDKEAGELTPLTIERHDLTDLFCITVDPEDAKDFDDAVSVTIKNEHEIILGIHIADVAVWITPNSKWDKKARKRGFTAYLPSKTLHMLPDALTKLISLAPNRESFAHSVLITINRQTGEIISSQRIHSRIKVRARLSFDEVQKFIDEHSSVEWPDDLKTNVKIMFDLYKLMRNTRKKKEKFLELATTEIRVICDEVSGEVVGIKKESQRDAEKMIEDFMLAANSEVAKELKTNCIPALYRVHPDPLPEKIEEFTNFVYTTFGFYPGDITSRTVCNKFLESLKNDHTKPLIINAFLRSLPRALYQNESGTHYGLGKTLYCHFTSPIRRYPDLLVHQQLLAIDTNTGIRAKSTMKTYSELASEQEANIINAWFAANDRLKLHYLRNILRNSEIPFYEAVIVKISSGGISIEVPEIGIYGFIKRENLAGRFLYRKKQSKLISLHGHQQYKIGDFIYVQPSGIDFIKGQALFVPVR